MEVELVLKRMRGDVRFQDRMFSYVSLDQRVPADHPLREIRRLTDEVLRSLSAEFDTLYAASGRPSIAPEYVLRALLLQVFYSVRSERQLMEQIDYNLLFRWFVGLGMDDAVWNHAVFSKNRDRLLNSEVAQCFFAEVNQQAKRFMSDDHFTVDGTLIQAWASQKSYRPKGGSDDGDGTSFHGQKRSNQTHQSTTDPDARSYRKSYGKESKLSYLGHALVENRNGLIASAMVTHADGHAERDAALLMLHEKQKDRSRRITVGADKACSRNNPRKDSGSSAPEPPVECSRAALLRALHLKQNTRQHPIGTPTHRRVPAGTLFQQASRALRSASGVSQLKLSALSRTNPAK